MPTRLIERDDDVAHRASPALPPGQRRIGVFPRFGKDLSRPAPSIPADPGVVIGGAVAEPFDVPLAELLALPRRSVTADFHCVAGWSSSALTWDGVPFVTMYRQLIVPALEPGTEITHVVFHGLDGFWSVVLLADALAPDVLVADRLDGRPLDGDHGAPARLISPSQYGYMSTKHLCRIDVHTAEPAEARDPSLRERLIRAHPRARVAEEERHGSLPGWLVRPLYRAITAPMLARAMRR